MLIITVNAEPLLLCNSANIDEDDDEDDDDSSTIDSKLEEESHDTDKPQDIIQQLKNVVGEKYIPTGLSLKDLSKWGTARTYKKIITNVIEETILIRNGGSSERERVLYKPIFYFNYSDGVKMLTVGGLIYREGESQKVADCAFEALDFYPNNDKPFYINVPKLTYKEIRHLDSLMPKSDCNGATLYGIPLSDANSYAHVYRYFPVFTEAEL
jgi:hypothetical protein